MRKECNQDSDDSSQESQNMTEQDQSADGCQQPREKETSAHATTDYRNHLYENPDLFGIAPSCGKCETDCYESQRPMEGSQCLGDDMDLETPSVFFLECITITVYCRGEILVEEIDD